MLPHYITKSFYCVGKDLDKCLNCSYCRLLDGETKYLDIQTCPTEINPAFSGIPVAVNLFRGDPMLQPLNTLSLLLDLEKHKHTGPAIVITKGLISEEFLNNVKDLDIDLHICLSAFGVNHPIDGGSVETFEKNIERVTKHGIRTSIEFRPIIYQINDSDASLSYVFGKAKEYGVPIGYCGLQAKPEVLETIKQNWGIVKPFPEKKFSPHKKFISDYLEQKMLDMADKYSVPIFRKTSCLISYQHGMERDYNAHYYRPNEVGCNNCVMKEKCFSYYNATNYEDSLAKTAKLLPYEHEVKYSKKHTCILAKQGICDSVTPDCFNIKGYLVTSDLELTTADVRITKWLTGLTMAVKMKESYVLSDFWNKDKT